MASPSTVKYYVLDSSVVNLILDGEMWDRCPSSLVAYKVELQAALFGGEAGEKRKLTDIVEHTQYLPRAISAHRWAMELKASRQSGALFITPTVHDELIRSLQFKQGNWADFEDLGIHELKGQLYRVTSSSIDVIIASLRAELAAAIVQGEFDGQPGEEFVESALNSLDSQSTMNGLKDNIKIYIEATIARRLIPRSAPGDLVMLITEDHQFFKIFARSPMAEGILLSRVDAVMGRAAATAGSPNLRIILAGEVVPGIKLPPFAVRCGRALIQDSGSITSSSPLDRLI